MTFKIWLDVPGLFPTCQQEVMALMLDNLGNRTLWQEGDLEFYFSTKRQERRPRGGVAGCVIILEGLSAERCALVGMVMGPVPSEKSAW